MGFNIDYTEEELKDQTLYSIVLFAKGHRVNFFNNIIGRDLDKAAKYLIRNWESSISILSDETWDKIVIRSRDREILTIPQSQGFKTMDELFFK